MKTKYLIAFSISFTPFAYILYHNHIRKPHEAIHCFYCCHTGKVLFGSLIASFDCAIWAYKNKPENWK